MTDSKTNAEALFAAVTEQSADFEYAEMHPDQYARMSGQEVPEGTVVVRLRRVHQPAAWVRGKKQPSVRWEVEFVREEVDE